MDDGRRKALEEAQHRDEVLVVNEFDFPFWGGVRIVIMRLQGFRLVQIVGLNLDRTWVGNMVIHVMHFDFYSKVQVWLKISDGIRSLTRIAQ